MKCQARIRPFPNTGIVDCELEEHTTGMHSGGVAHLYPGSHTKLQWLDDDRRNFRGEWIDCPEKGCTLPANHPRKHNIEGRN